MTKKHKQNLVKKHPILFKNIENHNSPMSYGCNIGDGWLDIFSNLCDFLDSLMDNKEYIRGKSSRDIKTVDRPNIVFDQVKEKFGLMRIYWSFDQLNEESQKIVDSLPEDKMNTVFNAYSHTIDAVIGYVEFLSKRTCETCGKPGKLTSNGWIKVRCNECLTKEKISE